MNNQKDDLRKKKYKESPYESKGINKVRRKNRTKRFVNEDTGEITRQYEEIEKEVALIDNLAYVKLYRFNILEMAKLDYTTLRLALFICTLLKPSKDVVIIDYNKFLQEFDYKNKMSYYNALNKLLDGGYIVKKEGTDSEFYVNTNLFFNGDRIKLKYK